MHRGEPYVEVPAILGCQPVPVRSKTIRLIVKQSTILGYVYIIQ